MLTLSAKLLLANNRCAARAFQVFASTHNKGIPSKVSKFNERRDSTKKRNASKSKFKSFQHENTLFDKSDPNADDDLDTFEDEDYDHQIINAHRTYDEYVREEKGRAKSVVNSIIRRKYFKEPPEPTLLTWAAKEQLRYLHDTDAETWTPERLAESFPITLSGVKKLLASSYRIQNQNKILEHDKAVYDRWKALKRDGGPILAAIHPKFHSGNLDLTSAKENCSLPLPTREWQIQYLPQEKDKFQRDDAPVGEFEGMILQYKNLCHKPEKHTTELTVAPKLNEVACYSEPPEIMESLPVHHSSSRRSNHQVTFDEFKKNMTDHMLKKSVDNPVPYQKFKAWVSENDTSKIPPPPPPMEELLGDPMVELFEGKLRKLKDISMPDLKWDVHRDSQNPDGMEAYIYESKHGYQRPYGRFEDSDHIEIPLSEWKEGAVYQRGDCFYDDNGALLYRVPFLLEK